MPKIESLNNDGTPSGHVVSVSDATWMKLSKYKKQLFRLAETDLPKVSRSKPEKIQPQELIEGFPLKTDQQLEWVKEQTDVETLEKGFNSTYKLSVKQAIKDKIAQLNAK